MHKISCAADPSSQQTGIQSVGIIGAGVMGTAIAAANLQKAIAVSITDSDTHVRKRAEVDLRKQFAQHGAFEQRLPRHGPSTVPLLTMLDPGKQLPDCDLVIETVSEEIETKRQVLQDLESAVGKPTILASNTSTISISALARGLKRPQLFCGIHFLAPVQQTKLIEIIPGKDTSPATIAAAVAYARRIDRSSIIVGDSPGFLVNRLLFPYLNEALLLLAEGARVTDVDRAARMYGMAIGPFEMLDLIGLDTALQAGRALWQAYPERLEPSLILPAMVKAGLLGQKVRCGFYRHATPANSHHENVGARKLIAFYARPRRVIRQAELIKRLFLPMLLEATRLIQEKVVDGAATIDFAVREGLGLSGKRDGLLKWADQIGAARICRWLEPFACLGPRMTPTTVLTEMAHSSKTFYSPEGTVLTKPSRPVPSRH